MREASKTNQYRDESFFSQYFGGTVLDIGAGTDLVCPHAQGFDMFDGDANHLDRYFSPVSHEVRGLCAALSMLVLKRAN